MKTSDHPAYKATIFWRILFLIAFFIILVLLYWILSDRQQVESYPTVPETSLADTVKVSDTLCGNQYMQLAVLYQQRSGEYRALCYQAFNAALLALKEDLRDKSIIKPRAIIADIDETILDNSPFEAECILSDISYPTGWDEWCMKAEAKALPGALAFCQMATRYGLDIFYITNRKQHLRDVTLKNLKDLGFPVKDDDHLLMRTKGSGKQERRKQVADRFHISLLLGDNLNDFSDDFYEASEDRRNALTDSLSGEFGRRFIVLPNPMYGDWESVFYQGMQKLEAEDRMQVRNSLLQGFAWE